jgi:hypothetical protein
MTVKLPRCLEPGCVVRYRAGPDRFCAMHGQDGDNLASRMEAFAALSAVPAKRDDDDGDGAHAARK